MERLEKSRSQLQFQRLAHPILKFQYVDRNKEPRAVVGEALWQTRSRDIVASTDLATPFMVPAIIESLRNSRWADAVSVVPGEAEVFCAPAARLCNGAVLTNDSDLVLFEDLACDGTVVMLNSLSLSATATGRFIEAQCWRPRQITQKLLIGRVLHLGFERMKDSTAPVGTILQRAKDPSKATETDDDYRIFAAQFSNMSRSTGNSPSSSSNLSDFDPRLAEVVCQIIELSNAVAQSEPVPLQVTLPILHEDPTRDSSWAYGRTLRHSAYCLLYLQLKPLEAASTAHLQKDSPLVYELSRKGQRIAEDGLSLTPSHLPISSAKSQIQHLNRWLSTASNLPSPVPSAVAYILWALHIVLDQRFSAGRHSYSRILIEQLLGLAPLPPERSQKLRPSIPVSDEANGWTLLHLNANVQAVLYSARMLKQTVNFLRKNRTHQHTGSDDEVTKLAKALTLLPAIQELFLDPPGIRRSMQQMPREELRTMIASMFEQAGWFSDDTNNATWQDSVPEEIVANQKSKRRKRAKAENRNTSNNKMPATKSQSTNPFALLMQ